MGISKKSPVPPPLYLQGDSNSLNCYLSPNPSATQPSIRNMPWARTSRRNPPPTQHRTNYNYNRSAPPQSNTIRSNASTAPHGSSVHGRTATNRYAGSQHGRSAYQPSNHGRTAAASTRYAGSAPATNPSGTRPSQSRSYAGTVASRAYNQRPPFSQGARTAASTQHQTAIVNQTRGQGSASAAGGRSRAETVVQGRGADRGRSVVPASNAGRAGVQGGAGEPGVVGYSYESMQAGGRRGSRWGRFRMFVWRGGSRR